ncbi:MAG: hypothetical protein U9O41_04360 [Candidatus Aerophobetes bacterium]|nr:hypothetical protein [Candidatus Aerophobetes bacterium]
MEEKGIRYVTASKNTHPLRATASSLPEEEWEEVEKETLYLTEIQYAYGTWKNE